VGCGGRGGDGSGKGIFLGAERVLLVLWGFFWGGGGVVGWVGGAWRIWFGEDTVGTREREKYVKRFFQRSAHLTTKKLCGCAWGGDKGDNGAAVEMRFFGKGKRQWRG